ncbi:D-ribose pyranase [Arthrobacter sp. zg-Y820]|uniref:D-ribose pyranase n=1 Tax=unclassified Arthrobacter TaxID=235627 RepID=UPI002541B48D|nr:MULTISPECIES: D-ribose pyranase [unclassified Arthrobacter]MCC9195542.1 D-ribose pyranase [Arthrobacter sp. zg-Y820]MDK1278401.1 D-ribose pyranase [Arthrobacter sp. zg.Y820]WIB10272.1 D-ribose pyranase [Arthrobacter sp. zg-Y820]
MKKTGILNAPLNAAIGRLGHGHLVVVADCGLPIPDGVPAVDLALVQGIPSFSDVLGALLDEIEVEGAIMAEEAGGTAVDSLLAQAGLQPETVTHEEFKALLPSVRLIVRTGEATPYANVMLRSGVTF